VGFLNGLFLFALGAVTLPVLIHILNRRRLRRVRFSTIEFIGELNKRRMSKINLRRWLVLFLRALAVALLVLAFARPTLRSNAPIFVPGAAPRHIIICLDVSYSMGSEMEEGTVFTRAREIAKKVVDASGDNDVWNVVAFSSAAAPLFDTGIRNRQVVKNAIDQMGVTAEGTSFVAALDAAAGLARAADVPVAEIYLISDFREGPDSVATGDLPENTRLILLPVTRESIDNVSIDRVFTPRKLIRPGESVRIGVAVTNHSREESADFPLELSVGGKRKAEKLVSLAPASSATETFIVSMEEAGTYRGRVSKNRDRLPIDDDRYLVLEVSRQIPVTVVRGRKWARREGETETQAAYFYLEKALNPRGVSEGEMRVSVADEAALAVTDLPDNGVMVWTDPDDADGRRLGLVERYVENGGAALVFLGTDPRSAWGRNAFLGFIGADRAAVKEVSGGTGVTSFATGHPIFGLFDEEELELLSRVRISRFIAASGIPADSILAYFEGDGPAVWECRRGRGRVVVVAAPPDLSAGNLPLSPMFLPFVHACVSYLASAGRNDPRHENLVGADLVFDLPPRWSVQTGILRVRTERGGEAKPVFVEPQAGEAKALVPGPREVGFYSLVADTTRVMEACVNIDTRESNLNARPLDRKSAGEAGVVEPSGDLADLASALERERQGREIFAVFLLAAAMALAAEALLGRKA
jgi:hypothetical protein